MLAQLLNEITTRIKTALRRKPRDSDDPDASFAMVGAPLRPRPPLRRSSIAIQPEP